MVTAEPGLVWRKSSFSAPQGNCVEVAWRKSSISAGNGGCVEVAWPRTEVAVRDSKNVDGPTLSFPRALWRLFLSGPADMGRGRAKVKRRVEHGNPPPDGGGGAGDDDGAPVREPRHPLPPTPSGAGAKPLPAAEVDGP